MPGSWTDEAARSFLKALVFAGIARGQPGVALAGCLPEKPRGRCVVVGAGKAGAAMAAAVEAAWPDVALSGVVIVPHGQERPLARIAVVGAAHPVPDAASVAGARRVLAAVRGLGPDDLVLALVSGGGSALMALPANGVTLAEKQGIHAALLRSGATIAEMNAVRRRLSAIKGGKLAAAAAPARVVTLLVSDVPGDDPAVIASGPTVPRGAATVPAPDPLDVVVRHGIPVTAGVRRLLAEPVSALPDLPPADLRFVARPGEALAAMAAAARQAGVTPLVLGDAIEGEARAVGAAMAAKALAVRGGSGPVSPPAVLLSGGETTVTIGAAPAGAGGRNTEFVVALALALGGAAGIYGAAVDSDGIDGAGGAAGGLVGPTTLARAAAAGIDLAAALERHDSGGALAALGDLVVTGPTGTNVNDLRAILVA